MQVNARQRQTGAIGGFRYIGGGLSDPFQPCERDYKVSLNALKIFAETQYPVIVSTKGMLITQEPYINLVERANIVVQISMACSSYDKLEPGAPTFEQRLEMIKILKGKAKKVICRIQPFICNVGNEIINNIHRMAEAGADGVTVEAMKFKKKKPGLVRVGGDYTYPTNILLGYYTRIKEQCHSNGIEFYCAENRLRKLGNSTACCGCGDLSGFTGNSFNAVSLFNGSNAKPTNKMLQVGTASCFKAIHQDTLGAIMLRNKSFANIQIEELQKLKASR